MIVFLNGRFVPEEQALVSVFDRSFLYGDGLFETVLVSNATPFRWAQHLERLQHGAGFLGIALPFSLADLTRFAARLIHLNQVASGLLRLTLSRGVGARGYSTHGAGAPTLVMALQATPAFDPSLLQGWKLLTSSFKLPAGEALAQHKTCNKLAQILARAQAEQAGADEALLTNTDGFVIEGASSNLFWIERERVCTPPLAGGILAGITRGIVVELCHRLGLAHTECNITGSRLLDADGVFLSLSSTGMVEAISLDGTPLRPSPITRRLQGAFADLLHRETWFA
jgi:branched-chain amino acid aminotransferase